ncbi:hypothetical protein ACSBR2_029233 [Camellia fascicularis]
MDNFDLSKGLDECEDVSKLCLVGKILAPKILNKLDVSNILHRAWKTRADVSISPWNDNVFLFQYVEVEDRQKVLLEAPWLVMGKLLVF